MPFRSLRESIASPSNSIFNYSNGPFLCPSFSWRSCQSSSADILFFGWQEGKHRKHEVGYEMDLQFGVCNHLQSQFLMPATPVSSLPKARSYNGLLYRCCNVGGKNKGFNQERKVSGLGGSLGLDYFRGRFGRVGTKGGLVVVASASSNVSAPFWDNWVPEKGSRAPSLSDIVWPSVGAFAAMAILGKIDQILAPKGISMTIAPLGAVCAVLFATPSSPGARKYNVFMAQIGCAAIGVLAFTIFGPGWLARSSALAAAIAFMTYTRAIHPPAASLPLLFIDGVKLHHLNFWYAFFPGAAGCVLLCLLQEIVCYLKENLKF